MNLTNFLLITILSVEIALAVTTRKSKCNPKCINSTCDYTGFCLCLDGYTRILDSLCEPVCVNGCINGYCIAPQKCGCPRGLTLMHKQKDNFSPSGYCKYTCKDNCLAGECGMDGMCECPPFYDHLPNSTAGCRKNCQAPCKKSVCATPSSCECLPGYKRINDTACEAICPEGCNTGFCNSPGHCICPTGYVNTAFAPCVKLIKLEELI